VRQVRVRQVRQVRRFVRSYKLQRLKTGLVVALAVMLVACAASRAFTRGERAARAGDWDAAVEYFRTAAQEHPDRAEYKIALERATFAAAGVHADRGRKAEEEGRLDDALREYRRASEFDPTNRQVAAKAAELERMIRERIEAARPRPEIERLQEQARRLSPEPLLSPNQPLGPVRFNNASLREILTFMGEQTGINVTFDRDFQDRAISVNLEGVTLEQALQQIMLTNQLFYKVLNERTIIVAQDTTAKRNQYEEQVVRTFFLSHTDATEMAQILNVMRVAGMAIQPQVVPNKTTNTIVVRASASVMTIIERLVEANDKPRAEVVIDVEILEVSRERAKQFGLSLNQYVIGAQFSPEVAPSGDATPPFNLNTISSGISTADFYLTVPQAVVRFLESDSNTKVLAKPQLRGTEGQKVTLNLGEEVPVPSTTFTPLATGGAAANPLTSYGYRAIGIIVDMTPRVTYTGEIVLDLTLENSARGQDTNIAGQNLPAFTSRKVTTRLRLRDGESNLLAGLLREDERRSLRGFPGLLRMPLLSKLFADNDVNIRQTDIVMLLTPRIVRSHELTARDVGNIYIGTQQNMALGGPPPLIGVPEPPPEPIAAPEPPVPGSPQLQVPPGSSPIPGFTTVPPATPAPPAAAPTPEAVATPAQPPGQVVSPPTPTITFPPPVPAEPTPTPAEPTPAPPATTAPPAAARVLLSAASEMRVGGGPYTVPVSINGATRLSTITISLTYNPSVLRVRSVQEGSFMRQGGSNATFTQQVDPAAGRVDIAITRPADQLGATGTGLLAAVLFEAVAPGTATLNVSGVGTTVGGGMAPLSFAPSTVVVK
jgi:type II secretory pathway component GspD/PulD (secretin)